MAIDKIFVKDISAIAITGKDAWNRPSPQPINVSVSLNTDFHEASVTDNLKYSINYAVLTRKISDYLRSHEHKNFKSLGNIAEAVSAIALDEKNGGGETAEVVVNSPKSEIRAESVEYRLVRSKSSNEAQSSSDVYKINKLRLLAIIGVFTFERLQKQIVDLDLAFKIAKDDPSLDFHTITADIVNFVETSNFKTVEALVFKIGQLAFQKYGKFGIESLDVTVAKPNAFSHVEGVGVSSTMKASNFANLPPIVVGSGDEADSSQKQFNMPVESDGVENYNGPHTAFIAVGSNTGDQVANISKALDLLKRYNIEVESTSSLYVSKPMYHLEQPDFINGVVKVKFSDHSPAQLLKFLKEIEYVHMSREKEFDNGPRSIDLDIVVYDNVVINTEDLTIPHKSVLERTFVLQPLCELVPPDQTHPISAETFHSHLEQLLGNSPDQSVQEDSKLLQIVPVAKRDPKSNILKFDQIDFQSPTLVMGILNMTPDSFSDGGKFLGQKLEQLVEEAAQMARNGAQIIDIGGVSTRPGSVEPSEEEELERVLPLVKAIRASGDAELAQCLISVDTYRATVAEQCLEAGADIINDISMGLYDERIFDVVAKYGCPYIMNHTRGTSQTMSKLTKYEANENDDIVEFVVDPTNVDKKDVSPTTPHLNNMLNGVSRELSVQILKSFKHGVRKWQIILDPGVGFAKNMEQNIAIVRNASIFKQYSIQVNQRVKDSPDLADSKYLSFNGMSVLVGTSRKRFLGTITGKTENATDRMMATAATVTSCIEQHVDIVRVHDVPQMKDVVLTSDAIYKNLY
ncbi:uncharacterized protein LODBEIA_P56640 [Lodderomyces beijingensis]|uniref:Folic acid synthesis protein fol1 n=1 Tax=Lodderomyces beijingensis TaxID=1775926 RepID=A0ABP0ZTH6_9ASCO